MLLNNSGKMINQKNNEKIEELIEVAETDVMSDEEITQFIIDSIDDGLKLMRLAKENYTVSTYQCTDTITSIASRLSFASAVLNPGNEDGVRLVMSKIFFFCGTIITSKECFLDNPELIERIFPFFQTMREWVETLVLHENSYAVASNLSSSLVADLDSFTAMLRTHSTQEVEDTEDDSFFLL